MSSTFALRLRLLLTAAVILCAGNLLPAQQGGSPVQTQQQVESSNVVIRKSVRRVIVDVVVTDSNGKPVHGLTRGDFSVAEDGKPQRVLSFDVHDFEAASDLSAAPPLPANTFMNVPTKQERGPLYVILFDMLNMRVEDQATARLQLLRFIRDKPEGARFAIFVLSDGLRLIQGFTADQVQLFSVMDPKTPRAHVPRLFLYADNFGVGEVSVIASAFTTIARFLDGLPGRKNVIWVTGSLSSSILPTGDSEEDAVTYSDEIKQAVDAMARSQVAVYPVDVRGVMTTHVGSSPGMGSGGAGMMTTSDSSVLEASYATEEAVARATGGRAFYSSNDLKESLTQATVTGSEYYTLSYSPTNQSYDGRMRKIGVELSQRGYRLSYRRSYYADTGYADTGYADTDSHRRGKGHASGAAPRKPVDSLIANMQHGAPLAHDLLFRAHIQRVGAPAKATPAQMSNLQKQLAFFGARPKSGRAKAPPAVPLQTYAIDFAVMVERPKAADAPQPTALEFAAVFYDAEGQMLSATVQSALAGTATGQNEASEKPVYHAQQQIDAPLNAASIRIAVRDASTDRVGAMEVTLPLAPEPQVQASAPDHAGLADR
ncbi:MAG: VWA domain-containing protein [Candidatus Sulfotelmatobacter sp.]|jgi:VWFA-related protein